MGHLRYGGVHHNWILYLMEVLLNRSRVDHFAFYRFIIRPNPVIFVHCEVEAEADGDA